MKLSLRTTALLLTTLLSQCNAHTSKLRGENHATTHEDQQGFLVHDRRLGKTESENKSDDMMGMGGMDMDDSTDVVTATVEASVPAPEPTEAPVAAPVSAAPVQTSVPVPEPTEAPVVAPASAAPVTTPRPIAMTTTTDTPIADDRLNIITSDAPVDPPSPSPADPTATVGSCALGSPLQDDFSSSPFPSCFGPGECGEDLCCVWPSCRCGFKPNPKLSPVIQCLDDYPVVAADSSSLPIEAKHAPALSPTTTISSAKQMATTISQQVGSCALGSDLQDNFESSTPCFGPGECGDGLCCIFPYCRCGIKPNPKLFPVIQCLDDPPDDRLDIVTRPPAPTPAPAPAPATVANVATPPLVGSCALGSDLPEDFFSSSFSPCFGPGECGDGYCCVWPYCRCGLKPNPKLFPVVQCVDEYA